MPIMWLVLGNPMPETIWIHNEKEIVETQFLKIEEDGGRHRLIIAEIYPEDSGAYVCEAFNVIGECATSCSVHVHGSQPF